MSELTTKFHIHVCAVCRKDKYCDGPTSTCQIVCLPFVCARCTNNLESEVEDSLAEIKKGRGE